MKKKSKPTIEEVRLLTGLCTYCEKPVDWFCDDCWFGLCNDCFQEEDSALTGKCVDCMIDKVPDLNDISIFSVDK